MRVEFVFAPRDGEEAEPGLAFEMPDAPRPGDRVTIARPGQAGTATFLVRDVHWVLDHPEPATAQCGAKRVAGRTSSVIVACQFAPGDYSEEEHKPATSGA